jgi:hypothetical protein
VLDPRARFEADTRHRHPAPFPVAAGPTAGLLMDGRPHRTVDDTLALLVEQIADRLADQVAPRVAEMLSDGSGASPWLTTRQAIEYTRLPEGTFRKLASCGKIPSHGGRSKLFYRPEIDQALLAFQGLETETRELRRLR